MLPDRKMLRTFFLKLRKFVAEGILIPSVIRFRFESPGSECSGLSILEDRGCFARKGSSGSSAYASSKSFLSFLNSFKQVYTIT